MSSLLAALRRQRRGTKPGLKVGKHDEEDNILNLAFVLPVEIRELVLQQRKLEGVDGYWNPSCMSVDTRPGWIL